MTPVLLFPDKSYKLLWKIEKLFKNHTGNPSPLFPFLKMMDLHLLTNTDTHYNYKIECN